MKFRQFWIALLILFSGFLSSFCGPPKPTDVPGAEELVLERPEWETVKAGLQSKDEQKRSEAVLLAIQFDFKQASDLILNLAKSDPQPNIRQTAALAVGQFKAKGSAPVLKKMLESDKQVQAEIIMEAMVLLGDKEIASAIVPYLDSQSHNTRMVAMQSLVALDAKSQGTRILAMAKKNSDPQKGRAYTMALGKLGIEQAGPHLRSVAINAEPGPNKAAAYLALGRIKDRDAAPLLVKGLSESLPKLRENSGKALIMIQDKKTLPQIYPLLSHSNTEISYNAANVLGSIHDPRTLKVVSDLLTNGPDQAIGPAAVVAGQLKLEKTRPLIEKRLQDKKSPDRERLAQALGWLGGSQSIDLLISVLQEGSGDGRKGAAWSLGIIGNKKALPYLVQAAQNSDAGFSRIAAEALGGIQDPQTIDELLRLVNKNSGVRHSAAESIAAISGDRSNQVLLGFMDQNDDNLKRIAMLAFAERKLQTAIPALIKETAEQNPKTQPIAIQALKKITGLQYIHPAQWLHWYEMKYKK